MGQYFTNLLYQTHWLHILTQTLKDGSPLIPFWKHIMFRYQLFVFPGWEHKDSIGGDAPSTSYFNNMFRAIGTFKLHLRGLSHEKRTLGAPHQSKNVKKKVIKSPRKTSSCQAVICLSILCVFLGSWTVHVLFPIVPPGPVQTRSEPRHKATHVNPITHWRPRDIVDLKMGGVWRFGVKNLKKKTAQQVKVVPGEASTPYIWGWLSDLEIGNPLELIFQTGDRGV